jgi:hypothetical protein
MTKAEICPGTSGMLVVLIGLARAWAGALLLYASD